MAIPFVVCRRRLGRKATLYGLALACPGTGAIPETVLIIVEHCCAGTRRDAWSWYRRQKAVVADDDYSVVAMVERSMRRNAITYKPRKLINRVDNGSATWCAMVH